MRSKLLLLVFLLFSFSSFSQDSSFQLKDYKYRTDGFRALTVSGGFSGSLNNRKTNDALSDDVKQNQIALYPFVLSYYKTISTDKRIHNSYAAFSSSYFGSKREQNKQEQKDSRLNSYFTWGLLNQYYKGKIFFEFGNELDLSLDKTKQVDTNSRIKNALDNASNTVTIGIGRGRIENVTDAQMAMYILNDLQKQGLLSFPPDGQTYNELAKLITQINNRRIFDYRRKRIYELTQIDSFLKNKGLATSTDIRHFTTINDNWTFAFNPYRFSGSRWFVRLKPGAELNYQKFDSKYINSDSHSRYFTKSLFAGPEFGFEYFVPVNLRWQKNFRTQISASRQWNFGNSKIISGGAQTKEKYFKTEYGIDFNAFYGVAYYPNTRTALSLDLGGHIQYQEFNDGISRELWTYSPQFNIHADYFISYRTRFYIDALVGNFIVRTKNYFYQGAKSSNYTSSISAGISHTIF
jgi:hypothetical protein